MSWTLTTDDLHDIAYGAALLGTGGGGDPYIGRLLAQESIRAFGPVPVLSLDDLPDDAHVVACGAMGAPTIVIEKLPSGEEMVDALRHYEACTEKKVTAIVPFEIGGLNSCLPVALAARTGLPLVDGDGMGRAFPELQMVTFNVYGIAACPVALADERGNLALVETRSAAEAEGVARAICIRMGGQANVLSFPMTGAECRAAAVPATLSLAKGIGRAVREAQAAKADPLAALIDHLAGTHYGLARVLGSGKVADVARAFRAGWAVGTVTVSAFDGGEPFLIRIQNENLIVERGDAALAMVPDLICLLDIDTAHPIPTERLRYGQRVNILAIRAPQIMRTEAALQVFGPRAFGLDHDYRMLG